MRRVAVAAALLTPYAVTASPLLPHVANGVPEHQHPAVVALFETDTGRHRCTAVAVDCLRLLTAAHCVCDDDLFDPLPGCQRPAAPGDFTIAPQHDSRKALAAIETAPDYVFGERADLALLRLAVPLSGIETLAPSLQPPSPRDAAGTVVGYGETVEGLGNFGVKRGGSVRLSGCDGVADDEQFLCWRFDPAASDPGRAVNSCRGDSGAPLLLDSAGAPRVSALVAGGRSACDEDDLSFNTALFANREWLQTALSAAPDCEAADVLSGGARVVRSITGFSAELRPDGEPSRFVVLVSERAVELRVTLNAEQKAGADFDLLLRHRRPPSGESADCVSSEPGNYEACRIERPQPGHWHGLIAGSGGFVQATVTVFYLAPEPLFKNNFETARP